MFGFGKRKCKECGAELAEMEALRDRADDLMKSSAVGSAEQIPDMCARCRLALTKSSQSLAMNLHVLEARRIEAEAQPSPSALSTPPPLPPLPPAEEKPVYQRGGEFQTEEEKQALFNAPTFDEIKDGQDLFKWLIGTKVGRNAGIGIFVVLAMIVNALPDNDEVYEPADEPVATNAPPSFDSQADQARPLPQPDAAPIPTSSARPSNNPGSWVTTNDYPQQALAEGREGATTFRLTVNAQGAVTDCVVTASSGHADLDATTCASVSSRARFERAPVGTPDRGYGNRVNWRIPK